MDFGLSRRTSERRVTTKTRTNSTILNETDIILAGPNNPGPGNCVSSPNSTNVAEMNFTTTQQNVTQNASQSMNNSRNVSKHEEIVEARIRTNEAYLAQLKSIDLSKYKGPNENKPKTDYTYAKTTSYVSTSKTEHCPMPNLCRRSRISPPSSRLINFPFSSRSPPTLSTSASSQQLDELMLKSEQRLSFFAKIKNYLTVSSTSQQATSASQCSTSAAATSRESQENASEGFRQPTPGLVYTTSASSMRPNLNIGPFLDEDEISTNQRTYRNQPFAANNQSAPSSFSLLRFLVWTFLFLFMVSVALFAGQRVRSGKGFPMDKTLLNDYQQFVQGDLFTPAYSRSSALSTKALNEANKLLGESGVRLRAGLGALNEGLQRNFASSRVFLGSQWEIYWPQLCQLSKQVYVHMVERGKHLYQLVKTTLNATANIVNTVEYKLPKFMDSEESEERKEIIKDYELLKEKIFSEAKEMLMNSLPTNDIETMRRELDQKFNYTLSLMSNKLVDQSMQMELSQANHEKELQQMKTVLVELESRYKESMEQLQEKLTAQTAKLEQQSQLLSEKDKAESQQQQLPHQTAELILNNPKLQEELKVLIRSSHADISFQKIEEYVDKTFYLYNADRTGMTDFASESIGGSILFTRCTEVYTENSRWFTVFDVPISRLTVSPRVVIQGTVQPGNCWGFKGDKGDLFIKLAAQITPTAFSLEHIPKELSINGKIDSAPQNFTVYGYSNVEEISDDKRLILGNFRYDNISKSTLQFFDAQFTYPEKAIRVIELKIESNAGNKDYTCLYKFRVHGKLFEQLEVADKKSTPEDLKN